MVFGVVHLGPFHFDDGEVVAAEWAPIASLAGLVGDRPFCPDSLQIVLPSSIRGVRTEGAPRLDGTSDVRGRLDDDPMVSQNHPHHEAHTARADRSRTRASTARAIRRRPQTTLRAVRVEVARWALGSGHTLSLDSLSAILSARLHEATAGPAVQPLDVRRYRPVAVRHRRPARWAAAGAAALGETLYTYLRFLGEHQVLDEHSSAPQALLEEVASLCGLDQDGRRRHAATQPIPNQSKTVVVAFSGPRSGH
ncbi:MAG: hypothetical protein R2698_02755 [Microthrixaceae bacterium]